MNPSIVALYKHYREHGGTIVGESAKNALASARIKIRFDALADDELVRLVCEPEIDYYDDSFIDTWGLSEESVKREKAELARRVDREGHWILVGQYRTDPYGEWQTADNCGGFIGHDWEDSGYDVDIMRSCIDAYEAATSEAAGVLAARATFAGVPGVPGSDTLPVS